jgi:hypothetical protein
MALNCSATPNPPTPDPRGWFEPILGRAPADWPWALPHFFAINVAPDPDVEVAGARASLDGSYSLRHALKADRSRVEVVGFWRDEFRVMDVRYTSTRAEANKEAVDVFTALPIRHLMHVGNSIRENSDVHITGTWPECWKIQRYQDLGVLCAFIYEQARQAGAAQVAEDFRNSLHAAWPVTEQVMVYRSALEVARKSLAHWLTADALAAVQVALSKIQSWYPGLRSG